ncbi:MAG TPA: SpoIIE family protein phosphatase [Terriglobales bacterium]|jgi:serine phosphatase RsbU (regulator of sigma subunit)
MATNLKPRVAHPTRRLHWGLAQQTMPGENASGDAALVLELPQGCLLAVADGLGHGAEAAAASGAAMQILRNHPSGDVLQLLRACHEGLRPTRGVVMSLAWLNFDDEIMTWAGVGNVAGMLLRAGAVGEGAREHLLCRAGVLGAQMPPPCAALTFIAPGDTLLFFTDGVHPGPATAFNDVLSSPDRAAATLLRASARGTDDALVLVARLEGEAQP